MSEQKFRVPWTLKQTFTGILLTLVPWITFTIVASLINAGSSGAATKPLTFNADLVNALYTFIFSAVIEGAFLIAPVYYARRCLRPPTSDTRSIADLLGLRRFNVSQAILVILSCMVFILVVNYGYSAIIQVFKLSIKTNDQVVLNQGKLAPFTTYATLLIAVTVAPFCEEVFFRSFVFMGCLNGMAPGWAVAFSALFFGVAHGDPASFPVLFVIGLALAVVRQLTNSFWPGFFLHALNNGLSALLVILTLQGLLK